MEMCSRNKIIIIITMGFFSGYSLLLYLRSQLYLGGSPFWVRFLHVCGLIQDSTIEEVTFRLHGWCMLSVFLFAAFTHLGTWMSVQWNACVHRLDLGLYSHPKEFWGMKSEPVCMSVNPLSPQVFFMGTAIPET